MHVKMKMSLRSLFISELLYLFFFYNSVEAKSHRWLSNFMFIVVFFYCLLQILTRTKYVVSHFGKQWKQLTKVLDLEPRKSPG